MVGSEEADPKNKKVSIHSPVGQSVNGKAVGDEVQVKVPRGVRYLRILDITVL